MAAQQSYGQARDQVGEAATVVANSIEQQPLIALLIAGFVCSVVGFICLQRSRLSAGATLTLNRRRSWLSPWRRVRVIEKEAQHLSRRIRPARVRVGALGTAAGPSVAPPVHDPLLQHRHPVILCVEGARECASAIRYLAMFRRGP